MLKIPSWISLLFFLPMYGDELSFENDVQPLLEVYCFDCHHEKKKEGQIRLDDLGDLASGNSHLWTKLYEQIRSGKMPPEDEETFSSEEKETVLTWIKKRFSEENWSSRRRLNRREFSAALQDLTGVPIDFAASLPENGKVGGFDTGAEGLKDTAETVGQMLEVTRRAVEGIRFLEPESEKKLAIDFREHEFTDFRKWIEKNYEDTGFFTRSKRLTCREGEGIYLKTEWSGDRGNSFLAVPVPADRNATLMVRLRLKAIRPMEGLPLPILWVKIGGKYLDYKPMWEEGRTLEYAVRVEDAMVEDGVVKIMLRSVVEMPYSVAGFENDDRSKPGEVPGGIGIYRPKFDRKKLRDPREQPVPSTIVESVIIDRDFKQLWPPPEWKESMTVRDDEESARELLKLWIERAWRRTVADGEVDQFVELFRELKSKGRTFDEALRPAFQAVLMSGGFRYFEGPDRRSGLNSRVSFMLTGRPADRELIDPMKLDGQVERLLASEGSRDFFEPFVRQWLLMEQPVTVAMSHLKIQDFRFGRHLKESMKRETTEYVRRLFLENRPASELIASDWSMLNDILARHYGIAGIEGAQLRKVKLSKASDPRGGGILGHAGIQSMLTWMGDNWVIYRGAWTLDQILDDPPPPAPLEVPELNPTEGGNRGKTFREVLQVHLEDKRCASCHKDMDPLGFAFQNFDLSGRWREKEFHHYERNELDGKIAWRGEGKSREVDTRGRLPNGEEFASYGGFKKLLVQSYLDDVVRGLMKRLTLYGTGRSPNVLDLKVIDEIMQKHRKSEYRLRDLLADLIASPVFLDHLTAKQSDK